MRTHLVAGQSELRGNMDPAGETAILRGVGRYGEDKRRESRHRRVQEMQRSLKTGSVLHGDWLA